MSKVFGVGDEVYFSKRLQSGSEQLKPGSVYYLQEATDIEGEQGFVLTNKVGEVKGTALPTEIKIKRAASTVEQDIKNQESKKSSTTKTTSKNKVETETDQEKFARQEALKEEREFNKEQDKLLNLLEAYLKNGKEEITLTGDLDEQINGQKVDPLQLARDLDADSQMSRFDIGGVLAHIYTKHLYRTQYGYTRQKRGFDGFVDVEIPGIGARYGRDLMDIYVNFTAYEDRLNAEFGETGKQLVVDLGVAKCTRVVRVKDIDSIVELIKWLKTPNQYGTKPTIKDLESEIKNNYKTGESVSKTEEEIETEPAQKTKLVHTHWSFTEDNYKVVEEVLTLLREQYPNIEKEPALLTQMCNDFLTNVQEQKQGALTEEQFIRHGETMFEGKRVLLEDIRTGQVKGSQTQTQTQNQDQELELSQA